MRMKTYQAETLEEAFKAIKAELGPDAIILQTEHLRGERTLRNPQGGMIVQVQAAIDLPRPVEEDAAAEALAILARQSRRVAAASSVAQRAIAGTESKKRKATTTKSASSPFAAPAQPTRHWTADDDLTKPVDSPFAKALAETLEETIGDVDFIRTDDMQDGAEPEQQAPMPRVSKNGGKATNGAANETPTQPQRTRVTQEQTVVEQDLATEIRTDTAASKAVPMPSLQAPAITAAPSPAPTPTKKSSREEMRAKWLAMLSTIETAAPSATEPRKTELPTATQSERSTPRVESQPVAPPQRQAGPAPQAMPTPKVVTPTSILPKALVQEAAAHAARLFGQAPSSAQQQSLSAPSHSSMPTQPPSARRDVATKPAQSDAAVASPRPAVAQPVVLSAPVIAAPVPASKPALVITDAVTRPAEPVARAVEPTHSHPIASASTHTNAPAPASPAAAPSNEPIVSIQPLRHDTAAAARIRAKLVERGCEAGTAVRLVAEAVSLAAETGTMSEIGIREALSRVVAGKLRSRVAAPLVERGGVIMAIGTTGIGKSTVLAKLLNRALARGKRKFVVLQLSLPPQRYTGITVLEVAAQVCGATVERVRTPQEFAESLCRHAEADLILVDTPAISPLDRGALERLRSFCVVDPRVAVHLVVSAQTTCQDFDELIAQVADLPISHLIWTKADETRKAGRLFEMAMRSAVPPSYLSDRADSRCGLAPLSPALVVGLLCDWDSPSLTEPTAEAAAFAASALIRAMARTGEGVQDVRREAPPINEFEHSLQNESTGVSQARDLRSSSAKRTETGLSDVSAACVSRQSASSVEGGV
ncbi:MAG: hypothetical protein U0172_14710 [Nitrospiraceae bacterium]